MRVWRLAGVTERARGLAEELELEVEASAVAKTVAPPKKQKTSQWKTSGTR